MRDATRAPVEARKSNDETNNQSGRRWHGVPSLKTRYRGSPSGRGASPCFRWLPRLSPWSSYAPVHSISYRPCRRSRERWYWPASRFCLPFAPGSLSGATAFAAAGSSHGVVYRLCADRLSALSRHQGPQPAGDLRHHHRPDRPAAIRRHRAAAATRRQSGDLCRSLCRRAAAQRLFGHRARRHQFERRRKPTTRR